MNAPRLLKALSKMVVLAAGLLATVCGQGAEGRKGSFGAPTENAAEIVAAADEIRFPKRGFQVKIVVTSAIRSADNEQRVYQVLSKGNERTLVLTREPAEERGQMLLMRDDDLWVFLPSVSQPVRLPLSQKLTGQVANGDLARANFAGDYTPKLIRREACAAYECYVLELTAARRGVTYSKVIYWVRTQNHWPHRAEFFTISGRLLKTADYEEFKQLGGAVRPTKLILTDAVKDGEISIMTYSDMKTRDLPDKVFTKQYLQKLQ